MKVTVIGNGVSRAPIPLHQIRGLTVGCNAVYRDYTPNYLCVVDHAITKEIHESDYQGVVYYRHMTLRRLNLRQKINWYTPHFMNSDNTGNSSILLAKDLGAEEIDLIGFDGVEQKLYPDTMQPNDKFAMWNERLMYVCKDVAVRRVVDSTCAAMNISSISVDDYIKELNENYSNR